MGFSGDTKITGLRAFLRKDGPFLAVIFGVVTAFYLRDMLTGATCLLPTYQDESQWLLYREFVQRCFSAGRFPLWSPDFYAGLPFSAWAHSSAFYPAGLLFAWFGFARGVLFNMWLHQLIFFYGLYYLCREARASRTASLWGTLATGVFILTLALENFLPFIFTGLWIPWIYRQTIRLLTKRQSVDLWIFIIVNLLAFLGGDVEMLSLAYELLAIGLLLAAFFYRDRIKEVLKSYILFSLVFSMAVLSALIVILPTQELMHFSIRSKGLTYEYFTIWSDALNSLGAFIPLLWCGPAVVALVLAMAKSRENRLLLIMLLVLASGVCISGNILGVMRIIYHIPVLKGLLAHSRIMAPAMFLTAPILALGFDAWIRSDAKRRWLGYTAILTILTAVINLSLLGLIPAEYLSAEPYFRQFNHEWIFFIRFFSPLLIIIGVIGLWATTRQENAKTITSIILFIILAFSSILPRLAAMPRRPLDPFSFPEVYKKFFDSHPGLYRSVNVYPWDRWEHISLPLQSGVLYGSAAVDGYITVSVDSYTRFLNKIWPGAFREQDGKIADLETAKFFKQGDFIGPETLPLINLLGLKYIFTEDKNIKFGSDYFLCYADGPFTSEVEIHFLRNGEWVGLSDYKMDDQGLLNCAVSFSPARGHGIANLHISEADHLLFSIIKNKSDSAESGLKTGLEIFIKSAGSAENELVFSRKASELSKEYDIDISKWVGKTVEMIIYLDPAYLMANPRIHNEIKYFKRLEGDKLNIYENPSAFPRAFLVHRLDGVKNVEESLARMVSDGYNLSKNAVWEQEGSLSWPQGLEGLSIDSYLSDKADLRVRSEKGAALVLTDTYYPGWKAYVDGREERIFRVDYTFRCVITEAGEHEIKFIYVPAAFRIGLWASGASLLFMVLLKIAGKIRKKKNE